MKNNLLFAVLFLISLSACKKEPVVVNTKEKVALLKIDYLTTTFEGGTEWTFDKQHPTFTIRSTYKAPGDFGNLVLHYQEENAKIFDGGIIWMGKGALKHPTSIRNATTFPVTTGTIQQPNFKEIQYMRGGLNYPPTLTNSLWQAIKNLQLVEEYLTNNPTGKLHFFLYTPSVGVGNPADWDWIVYLKG